MMRRVMGALWFAAVVSGPVAAEPDAALWSTLTERYRALRSRPGEAAEVALEALHAASEAFGPESAEAGAALNDLGYLYEALGRFELAERALRQAWTIRDRTLPEDDAGRVQTLSNLGQVLLRVNRPAEAEPVLRQAADILGRKVPPDHPWLGTVRSHLARARAAQGKTE